MILNEGDFMEAHQKLYVMYITRGGNMTFEEWMDDLYPPFTQEDLDFLEDNDLK